MGPRNRIRPTHDSAAFEFACDFVKRHFRIVAELNDNPADFQFGFVWNKSSVFFGEAEWRVGESVVFGIGESSLVASKTDAITLKLIEDSLFWNSELLTDLRSRKAVFQVQLAVICSVLPVTLLEKLNRI